MDEYSATALLSLAYRVKAISDPRILTKAVISKILWSEMHLSH